MWKKTVMFLIVFFSIESLLIQTMQGKDYPVKPVEFVTFQAPGSGFDIASRLIAEKF